MSRRNFNCVQPLGLVTTVFAISALAITGLQWMPVPANATERGEERRDARDTRQTGREEKEAAPYNGRPNSIKRFAACCCFSDSRVVFRDRDPLIESLLEGRHVHRGEKAVAISLRHSFPS